MADGLVESSWLSLKNPDKTRNRAWRGHDVLVEIWVEPTDLAWEGDEPLGEGFTGWDLTVRVSFHDDIRLVWSGDSCCGIWIDGSRPFRDDYMLDHVEESTKEAIAILGPRAARMGHLCGDPECIVEGVMER